MKVLHKNSQTFVSPPLVLVLAVLLCLDVSAGVWFFSVQQRHQQEQIEKQLTSVSNLKVEGIIEWRQRKLAEATLITEDSFFSEGIAKYFQGLQLENAQSVLQNLRSTGLHHHYEGVLLVDIHGRTVISHGPFAQHKEYSAIAGLAAQALTESRAVASDLFHDERAGGIFFAVATPLYLNAQIPDSLLGVVILVSDPDDSLFPFIQKWPIPSQTAESLLVRIEGNDVLFLNELRHRQDTALKLRMPRTDLSLPAALATRGFTGIVKGLDYRGEKVIAHLQPIPDSPWFFVCKIDESEAFAAWRSQSILLILSFSAIAALLIAMGVAIRQRTRHRYYRRLLDTEQMLRHSAERNGIILREIADGIIAADHLGRVTLFNPVAETLTGWQSGDALGRPVQQILCIIDEKTGREEDNPVIIVQHQKKTVSSTGNRPLLVRKDGRRVPIAYSGAPLSTDQGLIPGVVLVLHDQTRTRTMERLTEKRLLISEYAGDHSLDQLTEKSLDEICQSVESPIGFFHFLAPDGKTMTRQQWSTETLQDFCQADVPSGHTHLGGTSVWAECLSKGKPVVCNDAASLPAPSGLPPGHPTILRQMAVPVLRQGVTVAVLGVGNKAFDYEEADVEIVSALADAAYHAIEIKMADNALRDSLQTSDDLVRAIPSGLFIYRFQPPDKLVLQGANPEALHILGKSMNELAGLEFDTIWPEAKGRGTTEKFLEVMRTGEVFETEDLQYSDNRISRALRLRAFALPGDRLAVSVENRTEWKRSLAENEKMQAQLQQAHKMESVGRLAGGVAHDFNNMLSVILGNAELALERAKGHPEIRLGLDEIKQAALRSADLTRQLLAFARKQDVAPKIINLNHTIEGMLKMLRRLVGEDIQLTWLPQTGLSSVFIDPSQIDQILANLCVNSRDAIKGRGTITIETANTVLNEEYCRENLGSTPGDYVLLSFSDNGSGIERADLPQIFEPFFTTKKKGEGTGLGLSMVYGIVKQNSGFIKVYSEKGQGTVFKIYLPQHTGEVQSGHLEQSSEVPLGRGEMVLLVEDEKALLEMSSRMLSRLGYNVLATGSAIEAITLAEERKEELQILLTDIIMPEMNGHELAKILCRTHPQLKCLYMSGYTANVISRQGFLPEGTHFLQKPFIKRDLAVKLRQILSE